MSFLDMPIKRFTRSRNSCSRTGQSIKSSAAYETVRNNSSLGLLGTIARAGIRHGLSLRDRKKLVASVVSGTATASMSWESSRFNSAWGKEDQLLHRQR